MTLGEKIRYLRDVEGTLNWYDLDYWSRALELDLSAINSEHDDRIAWLPGAREFLARQRAAGRRLILATNSHTETLRIKNEKVGIDAHLDARCCAVPVGGNARRFGGHRAEFHHRAELAVGTAAAAAPRRTA